VDTDSSAIKIDTKNQISSEVRFTFLLIPAAFLALFFTFPVFKIFSKVLSINGVLETLTDEQILKIGLFTISQALLSTFATLFLGVIPAIVLSKYEFRGRRAIGALVLIPFMLPTVVAASAFVALLPEKLHNTLAAIIIVHIFFNIAVVVRIVGLAFAQIPKGIEQSAQTLGASSIETFFKVHFRLLTSALISSAVVIFLFTFTSFGVIQVIGGPTNSTLEVEVARNALVLGDVSKAAAISVIQLIFLSAVLGMSFYYSKRNNVILKSEDQVRSRPESLREKFLVASVVSAIIVAISIPIIALISSSFRLGGDWSLFAWRNWNASEIRPGLSTGVDPMSSIVTSIQFMMASVAITLAIGLIASIAIFINGRAGKILDLGFALPLATSGVTLGFGILISFSYSPIDWRSNWWIIPVGHSLIAIPFVIRILLLKLRVRPSTWPQAAATLGASPIRSLWTIDIARMRAPLAIGAGVAAAISLGEFGATTLLTRTGTESMPIAIGNLVSQTGDIPRAQGFMLASILAVVTGIVVFSIEYKNA